MDTSLQKLGKLPPDFRPKDLCFYVYAASLAPAPLAYSPPSSLHNIGMMLNNALGCCAIASPGHMIQTWTADAGAMFTPTDNDIEIAYEAVGGYVPGDPSTDQGCIMQQALNYWRKTGIAGHFLGANVALSVQMSAALKANASNIWGGLKAFENIAAFFANLHGKNPAHQETGLPLWQQQMMDSMYYFGAADLGVQLPRTAMGQNQWTVVSTRGDGAPGSWGGHSVPAIPPYDQEGFDVITWGQRMRVTWEFAAEYLDEADACLSADEVNAEGVAPNGFNTAELQADLAAVTA